ncbi:hypothetical protein L1987_26707 [Smallanthus sonchifolius]|uniref:Uncharacterized protein n=1 Tax=Smallanthus sonchifolius TaxID=185202 RepID=A0ACB9IBJ9_9ASTR|nr:hypothetical protein L1987_26707 [Smallanthus sonchifolius]
MAMAMAHLQKSGPHTLTFHKFTCSSPLSSPIALRRRSAGSPAYLFINVVVSDLCSNFMCISSGYLITTPLHSTVLFFNSNIIYDE